MASPVALQTRELAPSKLYRPTSVPGVWLILVQRHEPPQWHLQVPVFSLPLSCTRYRLDAEHGNQPSLWRLCCWFFNSNWNCSLLSLNYFKPLWLYYKFPNRKTRRRQLFLSSQNYHTWVAPNPLFLFLPRTRGIVPKGKSVNSILIKIQVLKTCSKNFLFALAFCCFICVVLNNIYLFSF